MRYTRRDVEAQVERLHRNLSTHGIETTLRLTVGSSTMGVTWKLHAEDGRDVLGSSFGFLGRTARESFDRLYAANGALEFVTYNKKEQHP